MSVGLFTCQEAAMKQLILVSALALAAGGGLAPFAPTASIEGFAMAQAPAGAPAGELSLGTVRIGRRVMADGKPLPAGTYRLRLTGQEASPKAAGQAPELSRWVEFLQGSQVKGREVASIVPRDDIKQIAKGAVPAPGSAKVELLKGNEYLRIWVNRGGTHYLIHLPVAS
jgi:hypothetical protein